MVFGVFGIGFDIGLEMVVCFVEVICGLKMVFWNGLMGVFEFLVFVVGIKIVV